MNRTRWILVLSAVLAIAALAIVVLVVLRAPPALEMSAQAMADLATKDGAAAKERFLLKRMRVTGVVVSNVTNDEEDGSYQMIGLDTKQKIEFYAAFAGKEAAALTPGVSITFDGRCELCETKVISFHECRLVK